MRVLLTGGRAPATLDLARILSRGAAEVLIAESAPLCLSSYSRCVTRTFRVPPPRQEPERFTTALRELILAHQVTHLIPTCEEIFTVLTDEAWLRDHVSLFTPSHDTLLRLHSKWDFQSWMDELQLQTPKTDRLTSTAQLSEHVKRWGAQTVYKPEWSRFGVKVQVAPEGDDWLKGERCDEDYPWLAQRRVEGEEWCSYSWLREGQVLAHVSYPMAFSEGAQASLVFAHQSHAGIEGWVRRFGEATRYTGQVAFDFIEGEAGLFAIECNPRLTSGVHTLIDQDLAALLSHHDHQSAPHDLAGGKIDAQVTRYGTSESQALKPALCLYAIPSIRARGLSAWLSALFSSRDVLWRWSDPLPGLLWPLGYLYFAWVAWRERISAVEASTFDIEWNSERSRSQER